MIFQFSKGLTSVSVVYPAVSAIAFGDGGSLSKEAQNFEFLERCAPSFRGVGWWRERDSNPRARFPRLLLSRQAL